jgi:glucosamine kinase
LRLKMPAPPRADNEILYLGIDGGGSKCRAQIVAASGETLGTGLGGPANPFHNMQQTIDSILAATTHALNDANIPVDDINRLIAGVGLAGVNVPGVLHKMKQWQHPFRELFLTTDLHIACLGVHGGKDGAVLVCGTGSCGYAYVQNVATTFGGHGFPCGDKGSGAWLGLEAVRAVLLAFDGLGTATQLTQLLAADLKAEGLMMVDAMTSAKPNDYARLARWVFAAADNGDHVAQGILRDSADYLSALADKLLQTGAPRFSFIGGISAQLTPWLTPAVASRLSEPLGQPEEGAIYFARQQS